MVEIEQKLKWIRIHKKKLNIVAKECLNLEAKLPSSVTVY